jgi:hypothetical protein
MVMFHESSTSIRQQEEEDEEGGRKQKLVASYRNNGTPMRGYKFVEDHRL